MTMDNKLAGDWKVELDPVIDSHATLMRPISCDNRREFCTDYDLVPNNGRLYAVNQIYKHGVITNIKIAGIFYRPKNSTKRGRFGNRNRFNYEFRKYDL